MDNLKSAIRSCLKKYNDFFSRTSRSDFWLFVLFIFIFSSIIIILEIILLNFGYNFNGLLLLIFEILIFLPFIAAGTRRLHDINKSGWWQLLLVTIIGTIPLIFWWIRSGKRKRNKYGVAPKSLKTLRDQFIRYNLRGISKIYNTVPSTNPLILNFQNRKELLIDNQIETTGLSSYLMYENDKVVIDKISPVTRFGDIFNNNTMLYSMSLGKSLTGYLMAHAIAKGYVKSLDQTLEDWPLTQNTLLNKLKIKEVINATMGDQEYFTGNNEIFKTSGRFPGDLDIASITSKELLGSKASEKRYFYGQLSSNVALNYISFKTGNKFIHFLNDVMQKHVKLEGSLKFIHTGNDEKLGIIQSNFKATRYDILRIGIAILKDWRTENDVGKILKKIYFNKIKKNNFNFDRFEGHSNSYAGFFHSDYPNMKSTVIGMHGTGGIALLINFEDNRIVYAHSVYRDYNYTKIVLNPIRNGKF